MTFSQPNGYRVYRFATFEEYLDRAANPRHKRQRQHNMSGWGRPVFDSMLRNARHGWTQSLNDIAKWSNFVIDDISTHLPNPDIEFDKVGTMWDLGRVIESDPECWIHEDYPSKDIDRHGKGNLIRMVINTASSAGVRDKCHLHRCGAILALTSLFEKCGIYVQFEVTTAIQVNCYRLEFRAVAKAAGEALNIAAISFWCSKEMEEHIDFAICETMQECAPAWCSAYNNTDYGSPIPTSDRGDICFDGMAMENDDRVNWNDATSVRHYVVAQLAKQGIKLQN